MRWEVASDPYAAWLHLVKLNAAPVFRDDTKGIVVRRDGQVMGCALYTDYSPNNLFAHIAGTPGKRWMTREFLHEIFKYPFLTAGVQRITAWIDANNERSIRLVEHFGFEREATLRRAGNEGGDVHLYVMFKEGCRYV